MTQNYQGDKLRGPEELQDFAVKKNEASSEMAEKQSEENLRTFLVSIEGILSEFRPRHCQKNRRKYSLLTGINDSK